jgi:Competence protein CoiA-like family
MSHDASQRYGLVDGKLVAALEMRGRINRPPVQCSFCKEDCTWVAGPIVTPHIRHQNESECSAEGWRESNEHLNGKMRILEVLRKQHRIDIIVCIFHRITAQWVVPSWVIADDEVRHSSGRVPDVALINDRGEIVAAIEVYRSHRVDDAKAASYAQSGIPWIEVTAEIANAWAGQPFACVAMGSTVWCRRCKEEEQRQAQIQADIQRWEEEHRGRQRRERAERERHRELRKEKASYWDTVPKIDYPTSNRSFDQQRADHEEQRRENLAAEISKAKAAEREEQRKADALKKERADRMLMSATAWVAANADRTLAFAHALAAVPCIVKVCPCGAKTPDIWTGADQTDGTVRIEGARITYGSGDRVAWIDIDPETPDPRWLAMTRHAVVEQSRHGVPVHGLCSYCQH